MEGKGFAGQYTVTQVESEKKFLEGLDQWPKAEIAAYPWGGVYRPKAYGICCAGPEALYVHMAAGESRVRCEVTEDHGPVCTDSCLEFFYRPNTGETLEGKSSLAGYFNFEWNPKGVLHLGYGEGRHGRIHLTQTKGTDFLLEKADFDRIGEEGQWYVTFQIPYAFIRRYVAGFDETAWLLGTGNFYKCGDGTESPHWGCFSPVGTEQPDYHRPEYFADLVRG